MRQVWTRANFYAKGAADETDELISVSSICAAFPRAAMKLTERTRADIAADTRGVV